MKGFSNSEFSCCQDVSFNFEFLGYQNGTILAILIYHVALMTPTQLQFNWTYVSGGDVVFMNLKMAAILHIGTEQF